MTFIPNNLTGPATIPGAANGPRPADGGAPGEFQNALDQAGGPMTPAPIAIVDGEAPKLDAPQAKAGITIARTMAEICLAIERLLAGASGVEQTDPAQGPAATPERAEVAVGQQATGQDTEQAPGEPDHKTAVAAPAPRRTAQPMEIDGATEISVETTGEAEPPTDPTAKRTKPLAARRKERFLATSTAAGQPPAIQIPVLPVSDVIVKPTLEVSPSRPGATAPAIPTGATRPTPPALGRTAPIGDAPGKGSVVRELAHAITAPGKPMDSPSTKTTVPVPPPIEARPISEAAMPTVAPAASTTTSLPTPATVELLPLADPPPLAELPSTRTIMAPAKPLTTERVPAKPLTTERVPVTPVLTLTTAAAPTTDITAPQAAKPVVPAPATDRAEPAAKVTVFVPAAAPNRAAPIAIDHRAVVQMPRPSAGAQPVETSPMSPGLSGAHPKAVRPAGHIKPKLAHEHGRSIDPPMEGRATTGTGESRRRETVAASALPNQPPVSDVRTDTLEHTVRPLTESTDGHRAAADSRWRDTPSAERDAQPMTEPTPPRIERESKEDVEARPSHIGEVAHEATIGLTGEPAVSRGARSRDVEPLVAPPEAPEPKPDPARPHPNRADLVVGDGSDRVALRISTVAEEVRVEARVATGQMASALHDSSDELRSTLQRQGLELKNLSAHADPHAGGRQPENRSSREPSADHTPPRAAERRDAGTAPAKLRPGVRVIA